MREVLIGQFLNELGKELEIEGIEREGRESIVREAKCHLVEAFEAANPVDEVEEQEVIRDFGPARPLARALAKQYSQVKSRRAYLWPALFAFAASFVRTPFLMSGRVPLFGREIWIGTLYLSFCAAILFVLGSRARWPLVGQFVALAVGLLATTTPWIMTRYYPVPGRDGFSSFVGRDQIVGDVAQTNRGIAQERMMVSQVEDGQRFFSQPSEGSAPDFLQSVDGYKLPEGIRESCLGVPERTGLGLTVKTWKEAVAEWNSHPYWIAEEGGRKTPAEVSIIQAERSIRDQQDHIAILYRSASEPWWVQLAWTLRIMAPKIVTEWIVVAIVTNAGWLLWSLIAPIRRLVRRRRMMVG